MRGFLGTFCTPYGLLEMPYLELVEAGTPVELAWGVISCVALGEMGSKPPSFNDPSEESSRNINHLFSRSALSTPTRSRSREEKKTCVYYRNDQDRLYSKE